LHGKFKKGDGIELMIEAFSLLKDSTSTLGVIIAAELVGMHGLL